MPIWQFISLHLALASILHRSHLKLTFSLSLSGTDEKWWKLFTFVPMQFSSIAHTHHTLRAFFNTECHMPSTPLPLLKWMDRTVSEKISSHSWWDLIPFFLQQYYFRIERVQNALVAIFFVHLALFFRGFFFRWWHAARRIFHYPLAHTASPSSSQHREKERGLHRWKETS